MSKINFIQKNVYKERYPYLHTPSPSSSPSLISLMVYVDVKHHVYLLFDNRGREREGGRETDTERDRQTDRQRENERPNEWFIELGHLPVSN